MNWYSRHVLSWEISVTMDEGFCVSARERALRRGGSPEISNTDCEYIDTRPLEVA